jgi:hypothetical protein
VNPTFKSGVRLLARARKESWPAILAVDPASKYHPGAESSAWMLISPAE